MTDIDQNRDRPERTKYSSRTDGVTYTLFHAVFLRDLNIQLVSFKSALLKRGDDIIGVPDRCLSINGRFHFGGDAPAIDDALNDFATLFQPCWINIHQCYQRILKAGGQQNVITKVTREDQTSRAYKRDSCHKNIVLLNNTDLGVSCDCIDLAFHCPGGQARHQAALDDREKNDRWNDGQNSSSRNQAPFDLEAAHEGLKSDGQGLRPVALGQD
jgi:hypothetical protein